MIKVIGQATQKDGTSPVWTLTGICVSAKRTATGTYSITCNKATGSRPVILISAERGGVGTERTTAVWSGNDLIVRNYTGQSSTTLGDCWLTVTLLENLSDKLTRNLKFDNNTVVTTN